MKSRFAAISVGLGMTILMVVCFYAMNRMPKAFSEDELKFFRPGDSGRGRETFFKLGCNRCHGVPGDPDFQNPDEDTRMALRFDSTTQTSDEVADEILKPSHMKIAGLQTREMSKNAEAARSGGAASTEIQTLEDQDLIDLVTYLRTHD